MKNIKLFPQQLIAKGVVFFLVALFFVSCKKSNPEPEPEPPPVERDANAMIRDSVYYYYKLYSLWADDYIPSYENPYEFTDQYRSAQSVLTALKGMTPAYPNYRDYGGVYDRFSFMEGLSGYDIGAQAKVKMDRADGYGLYFDMGTVDSKTAQPIIYFVEGGSPADIAGLKRSDIVLSINGESDYAVEIDCEGNDGCKAVDPSALGKIRSRLNSALDGTTLTIEVQHEDKSTSIEQLSYKTYTIYPIYKDSVYHYTGKNIGYLALSSFEEIENNNFNQVKVDGVFQKFEEQHIEDLVVDLRYNTGGYVDAAVYIANKIGGTKTDKKLMVTYKANAHMERVQKGPNGMFKDTYFSRGSSLNLRKVYFLVSETTASAAEMLINVLKPYFDVQVIATGTRTYGKPVGFFEQIIENKISFWPASFQLKNADGFSEYWDGLAADKSNVTDYIFLDSGNTAETMLETALEDSVPGSSVRASARRSARPDKGRVLLGSSINQLPEKGLLKSR